MTWYAKYGGNGQVTVVQNETYDASSELYYTLASWPYKIPSEGEIDVPIFSTLNDGLMSLRSYLDSMST